MQSSYRIYLEKINAKCEVPIMCSLKGIDINVTGKYGYQMKGLYQIMSILNLS